jgi:hypothetical protein
MSCVATLTTNNSIPQITIFSDLCRCNCEPYIQSPASLARFCAAQAVPHFAAITYLK